MDAETGGLSEALASAVFDQQMVPAPRATWERLSTPPKRKDEELILRNDLGGFSKTGKQYVMPAIGGKLPPAPWCNVVANPQFGFLVTETGAGYTWSENSRENRLTSWSNDPTIDPPSEVVYIRDAESGEYWSLTPSPAAEGLSFRVEHGFGYSSFEGHCYDVGSKLVISGSQQSKTKWYNATLTNHDSVDRKLELYFYVDLVLGVSREDSYRFISTNFDRTAQSLCAVNYYNNEFAGRVVAIGSSEDISGFTTSRLEFLGRNSDVSRPLILERAALVPFLMAKARSVKLSGKTGAGFDPCALIQVVVTVPAREQREVSFYLGESSSFEEVRNSASKRRSLHTLRNELQTVTSWWDELLSRVRIETPSQSFNVMMNGWLLYQTVSCRLFGRSGFYQSGGAFGFRDQLQDSLALLFSRPEIVRSQIVLHAQRQFQEGDVQHWWHPPTGRGVRTKISDDLLWLPYAVGRYIEATHDHSILDEQVPFLNGPVLGEDQMENYFIPERGHESGTILEHCVRTFRVTEAVGVHGLPLMGAGDWNDGMNEVGRHGKGESVWLAWFQIEVINQFIPALESRGQTELVAELRRRSEARRASVEEHGWDGEWYRRAFYDDGTPLGSHENDECKIDSLAQSWALISKAGDPLRAATAMNSLNTHLVDREAELIKVLTPPFDKTAKNPGYIKGYPPGIRENGGQYTHATAWVIIATALAGRGTDAVDLFELINPVNHTLTTAKADVYKAEPYVMCGDVYSEGEMRGRAGWSWYTGSSGWLYQAGIEHILGLSVKHNHFTINPTIPAAWDCVRMTYRRAGRIFDIEIQNSQRVEHGVVKLMINGKETAEKKVSYEDAGYETRVGVTVVMGTVG